MQITKHDIIVYSTSVTTIFPTYSEILQNWRRISYRGAQNVILDIRQVEMILILTGRAQQMSQVTTLFIRLKKYPLVITSINCLVVDGYLSSVRARWLYLW